MGEPLRERLREAPLANFLLRSLDGVLDAPVLGALPPQVEQQVRGAGVAVSRLPDRAGVEDPAALAGEVELGAGGRDRRLQALVCQTEREGDVAMPHEEDASLRGRK